MGPFSLDKNIGAGTGFGGRELGWFAGAMAKMFAISSQMNSLAAAKSAKMASLIRREQEWALQANLAIKEIIQLDKQLTSVDIRIQVAEKELANHRKQITDAQDVERFLKDKFTNQELYQWMKEQLFAVYKRSYNLAFDMAKKAENAYQYEMGVETAGFIEYGCWDNSMQGLVAGEKLQLALRQLEKSYLEENRRELELTKHVSLAMLNPLALIELRETGKCCASLPEELFDLDFQGHYFRRIKSVSVSIPCVAGPYTTVNCSLRLLRNTARVNTVLKSDQYEQESIDDNRFRTVYVPVTSIATSSGQNDAGMFEFSFRDERYLPFEGAGAISEWMIELTTEKKLRQFDYTTISDVILHLKYTARESGGRFKDQVVSHIKNWLMNAAELSEQPLMRMLSMRHEFPTEWHRFLHPATAGGQQILSFAIGKERFPFFAQDREILVVKMDVFAKCAGDIRCRMTYTDGDEAEVAFEETEMLPDSKYGGLKLATFNMADDGQLDVAGPITLTVSSAGVEDLFLVVHYRLGEWEVLRRPG